MLTHIHALTPIKQLHLYLVKINAVILASLTELTMINPDHAAVAGHACPWNTVFDVASALIDMRLHDFLQFLNHSQNQTVRCHITKALPNKDTWKQAYANNKDINYLISILTKDKLPMTEHEIRQVHKAFWQHLRKK